MQVCVDGPSALAAFEQLGARAGAAGLLLRPPPPLPTTCCGRGCNGCVWESFYTAANGWCDDAQESRRSVTPVP